MRARPLTALHLTSPQGELVQIQLSISPRELEDLLDCLATLDFPINPQIYHGIPTVVEFPAYESQLRSLRSILQSAGYNSDSLGVSRVIAAPSLT